MTPRSALTLSLLTLGCDQPPATDTSPRREVPAAISAAPVLTPPETSATPPPRVDADPYHAPCAAFARWLAYPATSRNECDPTRCNAAGGACASFGPSCPLTCMRRTTDGGKRCKDSSECQGGCYADAGVAAGQRAQGACDSLVLDWGCLNVVRDGRAMGVHCDQ